jgi:hypothetical protein
LPYAALHLQTRYPGLEDASEPGHVADLRLMPIIANTILSGANFFSAITSQSSTTDLPALGRTNEMLWNPVTWT